MKRFAKCVAAALTFALLLSGCSDLLKEVGVPDEYAGKADEVVENVAGMVSEGADKLTGNLDVMTDRLAELIVGSDQAYSTIVNLYAKTRLAVRYDELNTKAMDGTTFWNAPYEEGKANRLCKFKNLLGGENAWYTSEKNPYSKGQCTWYAFGRFGEDNGIALGDYGNAVSWLTDTETWVKTVYQQKKPDADMARYGAVDGYLAAGVFVSRGQEKIYPHSIAVCNAPSHDMGHVVYIEDVKYVEGKPVTVYFSEANWKGEKGTLDQWDGVLQSMDYETFLQKRDVLGYIVPLNIFI